MKKILLLAVLLISSTAATFAQTTAVKNDTVSYLIGVNFGSFIKGNGFPADKLDVKVIYEGAMDFLKADGNPYDPEFTKQFRYDLNQMGDIFNRFLEAGKKEIADRNMAKQQEFLDANKLNPDVCTSASGLQYKILNPGNAVRPQSTDKVLTNYKGYLIDNTIFDENTEVEFIVDKVIKGFSEGLQLIGEGGKIILYIPSDLAYGEAGNRAIEPNSLLIFEVELLKIVKE